MYNSGFRQGRLPDSLDLRNLCSIGGTGNCSYLTGKTGQYDIEVTYAGACSGTTTTTIRVNLIQGVSDLDLEVNGQTGTPDILLCDGDTDLELETTPTGSLTGYRIMIEKGDTLPGGAFNPVGPAYQSAIQTATSIPAINLRTYTSYLNGYSGFVRATVKAFTPCDSVSASQVFHLTQGEKISSDIFTLNDMFQPTPGSTPPVVWICTDSMSLMLKPGVVMGLIDSYSIRIDKGEWLTSTSQFIDTGNYLQYPVRVGKSIDTIELYGDTITHQFLGDTSGFMKFTLDIYGPCGDTSISQVFNIQFATLDFKMLCNDCPVEQGGSARHDSLPMPYWNGDITEPGWQGNVTVGIVGIRYSDTTIIDTTFIVVDEVDASGNVILDSIVVYSAKVINNAAYSFTVLSDPPYFFLTVDSSRIFRATVTSVTTTCGTISNLSYFRIAPGIHKPASIETTLNGNWLKVYPNPVTDAIIFRWDNDMSNWSEMNIHILDIQGRTVSNDAVLPKQGMTEYRLNFADRSPGIYFYRVIAGDGIIQTGKFEKH